MATISSPRRGSGGDRGDIKVAFKARKNPSLPDYSHVKSKIRTCWEPRDKNVGEVGVASEKSSNGSESGSPSTPRRSTEGAGMTPTRKKSVGSARFRITDYSHVTSKVDSIRKVSSGSEEDISRGVAKKVRGKERGGGIEEVSWNFICTFCSYTYSSFSLSPNPLCYRNRKEKTLNINC